MSTPARLLVDVSYTRTQAGAIGITRTVRRLFEELRGLRRCEAVAFHSGGFRLVTLDHAATSAPVPASTAAQRAFGWIHGDAGRALVSFALRIVPWFALRPAWQAVSTMTFNGLVRTAPPVRFGPGDTLLVADASWNYPAWRAARRARSAGAKVVLLVYDLMPLRQPQFCFPLVPRLFHAWLVEMLACSDAVVCISRATRDDLCDWARVHTGHVPRRVGHFRLGSDPAGQEARGGVRGFIQGFLDDTIPCFAAVGSFEPKKNYGLLLDVFERLWEQGHRVRLLLAGRLTNDWPAMAGRLRRHPQNGGLLLAVHDASDAEVLCIYERCRALLLPSLFEGFGLPLVEARSRGCPVIASNLAVFAELADAGVTLFDVSRSETLEAIVLQHVAAGGRMPAPRMPAFTWGDSARQCVETMETLLAHEAAADPGTEAIVGTP